MTNTMLAKEFAAKLPDYQPKVWVRGSKVRVYLRYPRNRGCAGGGELGYVDFSGATPNLGGLSADSVSLDEIKEAL